MLWQVKGLKFLFRFVLFSITFVQLSFAMTESEMRAHLEHVSTFDGLNRVYTETLGDRTLVSDQKKSFLTLIRSRADVLLDQTIAVSFRSLRDSSELTPLYYDLKDLVMNRYRHFFALKDKYALEDYLNLKFRIPARSFLELLYPYGKGCEPTNWYQCQGTDCKNGQVLNQGDSSYLRCVVCGHDACLRCGGTSEHSDCEQYEEVLRLLQEAGVGVKPCPNCRTMVSKDGGCDRMTCSNCGKQWEWSSGKTGKDLSIEHKYVRER